MTTQKRFSAIASIVSIKFDIDYSQTQQQYYYYTSSTTSTAGYDLIGGRTLGDAPEQVTVVLSRAACLIIPCIKVLLILYS